MKRPTAVELEQFRRLDLAAQRTALIGTEERRTFTIERAEMIDEKARTAWLSIASRRRTSAGGASKFWTCSKGAIRDARLKSGAAVAGGPRSPTARSVLWRTSRSRATRGFGSSRGSAGPRMPRRSSATCSMESARTHRWATSSTTSFSRSRKRTSTRIASPTGSPSRGRSLRCLPTTRSAWAARTSLAAPRYPFQQDERTMEKTKEQIEQESKAAAEKAANEARAAEQKRVADIFAAGAQYKDLGGAKSPPSTPRTRTGPSTPSARRCSRRRPRSRRRRRRVRPAERPASTARPRATSCTAASCAASATSSSRTAPR
jgi:hypothetical protein